MDLAGLAPGKELAAVMENGRKIALAHDLTGNEIAIIRAGGLLNYVNNKQK